MCPICLRHDFSIDAVYGRDPILTLEHCIPKKLAASKLVLTCKECNNTTGHSIDSHLQKLLKMNGFWAGEYEGSVPARINIAGQELGARVRRQAGKPKKTMQVFIDQKTSNPAAIKKTEAEVSGNSRIGGFAMRFAPSEQPNTRLVNIALLKSGYLLMFKRFGYSYILNPALNPIRQQIGNPNEEILRFGAIILNTSLEKLPSGIAIVTSPSEFEAFVVPIRIRDLKAGKIVVLPSNSITLSNWAKIQTVEKKEQTHSFRYSILSDCDLLDPLRHIHWKNDGSDMDLESTKLA